MQFVSQKITEKQDYNTLQQLSYYCTVFAKNTVMHMGVVEWGRGYGGSCEGWNKVITTPECDKSKF